MSSELSRRQEYERIRILSLDGGGIYGLTTAILLRKLCEMDPNFLRQDRGTGTFHMFAGTSSGAINSLLMASQPCPRTAVLGGMLEQFWHHAGTFTGGLPVIGSIGLTSFFSAESFLALLHQYFGNLRLGDLPHKVLISTYNWTGATSSERAPELFAGDRCADHQFMHVFRPPTIHTGSRAGQTQRHWRPKFFDNLRLNDPDNLAPVAHVAYAAAAPPGFRPLLGGLGDGGSFNANPAVPALARVVKEFRFDSSTGEMYQREEEPDEEHEDDYVEPSGEQGQAGPIDQSGEDDPTHADDVEHIGPVLKATCMLSVGAGQILPSFAYDNSNLGPLSFMVMPSNPFTRAWLSPAWYSLDPATEESDYIVKQLLTPDRALRLNPPLNPMPTVMAAFVARSTMLRQQLIQSIYRAAEGQIAREALEATVQFISRDYEARAKAPPPA